MRLIPITFSFLLDFIELREKHRPRDTELNFNLELDTALVAENQVDVDEDLAKQAPNSLSNSRPRETSTPLPIQQLNCVICYSHSRNPLVIRLAAYHFIDHPASRQHLIRIFCGRISPSKIEEDGAMNVV